MMLFIPGRDLRKLPLLVVACAGLCELCTGLMAQSLSFTEYPIPTASSSPWRITVGPDGALWFTEQYANKIGRITTSGKITEFPVRQDSQPDGIVAGPDGALWFTEERSILTSANAIVTKIGRITTSGEVTEFTVPGARAASITVGPDGALWFTEFSGNGAIGRITTGGAVTLYGLPKSASNPMFITTGPDGALWFTESGDSSQIGRITTSGVITEFPLVALPPAHYVVPSGITTGPDGALWFTESQANKIGRITTAGAISEFPIPNGYPADITKGPGGALWFTDSLSGHLGRITTGGLITEYAVPTAAPYGITVGPDNNIWFTEPSGNKIGRASLNAVQINNNGVVNNASFDASSLLAAGSIAAIFGSNLTDGTSCLAPDCSPTFIDGRLKTMLDGAQVTVNGIPAPIFYASPQQLGIQIPTELTESSAIVQVSVGSQSSSPMTISLVPAAPGIFFTQAGGQSLGAITHADGSTVTPGTPAQPGELVVLYATGLGQVTPFVPTGAPPPSTTSISVPQVMVTIDGAPVTPDFSGLSGCCPGLNQVNVRIPLSTRAGDDVPVILKVEGRQSNTVVTSVRQK